MQTRTMTLRFGTGQSPVIRCQVDEAAKEINLILEVHEIPENVVAYIEDQYGELAEHVMTQMDNAGMLLGLMRAQRLAQR